MLKIFKNQNGNEDFGSQADMKTPDNRGGAQKTFLKFRLLIKGSSEN